MSAKAKVTGRILGAVRATARDLHDAGLIDTRRMREYDARWLAPIPKHSSRTIRALRGRSALTLGGCTIIQVRFYVATRRRRPSPGDPSRA
jgi:hypothetical protein